jgi:hypothetical protein
MPGVQKIKKMFSLFNVAVSRCSECFATFYENTPEEKKEASLTCERAKFKTMLSRNSSLQNPDTDPCSLDYKYM